MSVKEVFVSSDVPELLPLDRVTKECVWEAVKGAHLRLEALTTYVDDDTMTAGLGAFVGFVKGNDAISGIVADV